MPGNKEIYDHLCFSLGWIFSSGGQYHGELPEIHYCNAAGSGGDCRQQRTLSSTQEAYVVSMNLGADDGDDDDADDADDDDDDAGWEGKKKKKKEEKKRKRKEKKKGGLDELSPPTSRQMMSGSRSHGALVHSPQNKNNNF